MQAIQNEIARAMTEAGIPAPEEIIIDDRIHRFQTNGKPGDRAGYYCLHDHGQGFVAGFFGCWRSGIHRTWHSKLDQGLDPAERARVQEKIRAANARVEAERKRIAEQARETARKLWERAKPASPDHPYLKRKGIRATGEIKQLGDALLVPVLDCRGELHGLQLIYSDGNKRFLTGTQVSGHFFQIGKREPFYIVEGYATGASVWDAVRGKGTVVVAFNAGNLLPVAKVIREANPSAKITICADDDAQTRGNPGLTKATEAAKTTGALLTVPRFQDTTTRGTDFNDLDQLEGLEAVKRCLKRAKLSTGLVLTPLSEVQHEEVEWLWEPYLPLGKITLLEGDPGVGKTWLALAICAKLVEKNHTVVYASCEDGIADTLKPRVEGMGLSLDLDRFFVLEGNQKKDGMIEPFTLRNRDVLEEALRVYRPSLVVLDPIQGFLGGDVDFHRANEVRARLAGVIQLAEKYNCAFLLVRHLAKTPTPKAIYRGLGSIDFSAVARSILLVGEKASQKVMVHTKSSLGEKGPSLAFEVKEGRFFWVGESHVEAADLLKEDTEDKKTALDQAVEFLQEVLSSGPMPSNEIQKHAKAAGISGITLRRAKNQLHIWSKMQKDEKGKTIGWVWGLLGPDDQTESSLGIQNDHLDSTQQNQLLSPDYPDDHLRSLEGDRLGDHLEKLQSQEAGEEGIPDGQEEQENLALF